MNNSRPFEEDESTKERRVFEDFLWGSQARSFESSYRKNLRGSLANGGARLDIGNAICIFYGE